MTRWQAAAAQAAAEPAVQATMQGPEPHDNMTAIVEVPSPTTTPTLIEVVPDATDQLQAALVAGQGYVESELNELANRQLVIVQEFQGELTSTRSTFQGELTSTRSTFQEQITRVQNLHADLGAQLGGKVNKSLAQHTINTKIKAINDRLQKQIMEQLTSRLGPNPSNDVEQLVLKSTADMESRIRASVERRIKKLHTSKVDARNEGHINENFNEVVHKLVETCVSNMAHRLEQSIDLRLDDI
ncbi:unnamed protein product [Phytophthora fragariaefolia]|uniref:Unnamed protein product n=1 Tax=Phytophthora fragariaefolia TaxID=1490495 RepID=A0A9W6YPM2_9STRA|nr:unnamed protein product [Phytophthora fragariaefolia]